MPFVLILALIGGEEDRYPKGGPVVAIRVHRPGKVTKAWVYSLGDGLVLTSRVAIAGARKVEVEDCPATLVRADRVRDLALLKVELGEHRRGLLADRPPRAGDRVNLPGGWPHGDGVGTVEPPLFAPRPGEPRGTAPVRVFDFQPRNVRDVPPGMAVLDEAGNLAGLVAGSQPNAIDIYRSRHVRFVCVTEIRAFLTEAGHVPAPR